MKKRLLAFVMTLIVSVGSFQAIPVSADSNVKPTKVSIVQNSITVYKGSEFEINAKMTPSYADDDYLRWSIVGKKGIIQFDDDDRTDDEAEFRAVKVGTTKVKVKISGTNKAAYINVTVKNPSYKSTRVGASSRSVYLGKEIELKVKKSGGLKDSDLKWSIKDESILAFEDGDNVGDDVELIALKVGKTKVSCYNKKTKKTISYTVTVKKKASSSTVSRVGSETKRVEVDDDLELKVKDSSTASKYFEWEIKNTSILRFDENDNVGKEVEVEGLRTGQTTVICTNTKTNKKITYTVIVIPEVDD